MLAAHEYKYFILVHTLSVTISSEKNVNQHLPLFLPDRSLVIRESVHRTL